MLSNLPPGVTTNMIPGNRPEDEAFDYFVNEVEKRCPNIPDGIWDEDWFFDLLVAVRDLGWEMGASEARADMQLEQLILDMQD